jgi:hypothetical protein
MLPSLCQLCYLSLNNTYFTFRCLSSMNSSTRLGACPTCALSQLEKQRRQLYQLDLDEDRFTQDYQDHYTINSENPDYDYYKMDHLQQDKHRTDNLNQHTINIDQTHLDSCHRGPSNTDSTHFEHARLDSELLHSTCGLHVLQVDRLIVC